MNRKVVILLVIVLLLVSCSERPQELPPGYSMLCSKDSSKFVPVMPGGTKMYNSHHESEAFGNIQDAINAAWDQYEYVPGPRDTVDWQEMRVSEKGNNHGD